MSSLDQILESLVQACEPTEDDRNKRANLIHQIAHALQRLSHVDNLRVVPYGSFVSQFYNSTSDLDLAICGTLPLRRLKPASKAEIFKGIPEEENVSLHKLDRRTKAQLLRDVAARLLAVGLARRGGVEYILHARVPIIKFVHPATGIEVDLCLGSDSTPFKAWSVAQVASIHPAFGKLFRVVKVWAKAHSINDGASCMFNSWCLTLVVISFLQTYPDPPLLPPLHALLFNEEPDLDTPRLMQGGKELQVEVTEIMEIMALRTQGAQALYGSRPCKPVDQLFRDFVGDAGRKLRSLLAREDSFLRDTRVSAYYGKVIPNWPFANSYVLCVEDPYDDTDNTARTLGTWESHPGTIHYVTSAFERTLRHLNCHTSPTTAATGSASGRSARGASDCGSSDCGASTASSAIAPQPSAPSTSAPSTSLAATAVFLFGTELLVRLPALAEQLLGAGPCEWARGALLAGRPAGEVHQELLRRLGADNEFVSFDSFKRRHHIKVHNEAKYATPEEKAVAAAEEEARRAAKKAHKAERRAARRLREAEKRLGPGQQEPRGQGQGRETEAAGAAAEAAVSAALGGKQRLPQGIPQAHQSGSARPRRKARNCAIGGSGAVEAATASAPPPPPPRQQMAPPQPQQQAPHHHQLSNQQQQQLRACLTTSSEAALQKAMSYKTADPAPVPGLEGMIQGPQSTRAAAEGVASATAAADAALRPVPREARDGAAMARAAAAAAAEAATKRIAGLGEASTIGGGEMAADAAAAAAAGAAKGRARPSQLVPYRRPSRKGRPGHNKGADVGDAERRGQVAEAGKGGAAVETDVLASMQGLTVGGKNGKGDKGRGARVLSASSSGGGGSEQAGEEGAVAAAAAAAVSISSDRQHGQQLRSPSKSSTATTKESTARPQSASQAPAAPPRPPRGRRGTGGGELGPADEVQVRRGARGGGGGDGSSSRPSSSRE